jgi:APA family basic amino acid/polyamine antiporter
MTEYLRKLTLTDLSFIGIGSVVGAGIFALVGKASAYSGKYTWISAIISGIIIYYVSRSYIKINEIYNSNDSEYLVMRDAFGEKFSNIAIFSAIIGGILTCYIVGEAFGGYASSLFSVTTQTAIISCIMICALINIMRIEQFAIINNITAIMGIIGLFLIILMGLGKMLFSIDKKENFLVKSKLDTIVDTNDHWSLSGIAFSSYIMLFSYFGFEALIKFNEESINPKVDIAKAINLTIVSATILYALVSYISLKFVSPVELYKSDYPLAEVASRLTSNNNIISYIKLAAILLTFNTYLVSLGATARLIDKFMGNRKQLWDEKLPNERTDTREFAPSNIPTMYIVFTTILIILLYMYNMNMITAVTIGNFCVLLLFATVSAATKMISNNKIGKKDIRKIKTLKN